MNKVILFYKFVPLADPSAVMLWQKSLSDKLELKGRIIISKDGINGTLGGNINSLKTYVKQNKQFPAFKDIKYKWSAGTSSDFPKMSVRVRDEVGLFLGFFLPGDTLLIAAGVYAMQGKLSIAGVMIVAAIAAVAGDSTAYLIGRTLGPRVFKNKDSVLFNPKHVKKAEGFYERYGPKAVLVAHYMPVVRTFTPLLGGVARMPYPKFLTFDAIGDTSWAVIVSLLGYYVGSRIPNIDHYILIAVAAVIIISATPTIIHLGRHYYKKHKNKPTKGV